MRELIEAPLTGPHTIFLEGPAGAGKTTLAVQRLRHLLASGVPGDEVLVLVPQRGLARPYQEALRSPELPAGSEVTVATVGGLAKRASEALWPLIAPAAGFARPADPPIYLTLETAQYYMYRVLEPFLQKLYFDGIAIRRNRLASQVLDNLNKAAVVGFPLTEIASRLKGAWTGESSRLRIYDQVQEAALAFRDYCLTHGLLDFSLQVELLMQQVITRPEGAALIYDRYRHIIADNIEEDVPVSHDLLRTWLRRCETALLVHDWDGGYRAFMAADPQSAAALKPLCRQWVTLPASLVMDEGVRALAQLMSPVLRRPEDKPPDAAARRRVRDVLRFATHRFHPQMLDWAADEISRLVMAEGVPPDEIAVLAPYLSDALRFSLSTKLERYGIRTVSHRPSRALREEAGTRCLLTLAALAHPQWQLCPPRFDVAQMLVQAIAGMDLVRADQLAQIVYRCQGGEPQLSAFRQITPDMQQRITYLLGGRYDELHDWLQAYRGAPPLALDHFLAKLFGELLSHAGFGFHRDLDAARAAANLIASARHFRQAIRLDGDESALGRDYLEMVAQGVVAAQFLGQWQPEPDAVLLAPAYTFLMRNRPVDYQFWVEIGSTGWWERPYQPLTHPYVLTRHWPPGRPWTDADEYETRQRAMAQLLLGLLRRCRKGVYLGLSDLGERGYEQRGPLLDTFQEVLRHLPRGEAAHG